MIETKGDRCYVRVFASALDRSRKFDQSYHHVSSRRKSSTGRSLPLTRQKGDLSMMDLMMVGTLLVGVGLVWALLRWCQKQVDTQDI